MNPYGKTNAITSCVCGCCPPKEPNPDCERCQLIVENQRLRDALEKIRDGKCNQSINWNQCGEIANEALTHGAPE